MTVGTSIIQIEAKDADTGPNGDVHYRLKQDLAGHWRTFHIDDTTGIISLKLPLDRETQKLYEVIQITFFIKRKSTKQYTREDTVYVQVYVYSLLLHVDKFAPYNHIFNLIDIKSRCVTNCLFPNITLEISISIFIFILIWIENYRMRIKHKLKWFYF